MFIGNALSAQISERLLTRQVTETAERIEQAEREYTGDNLNSNLNKMGYSKLISGEFIVDNLDVSMSGQTVLTFFAMGIAAVVLATAVSMIYILILDPKKIM